MGLWRMSNGAPPHAAVWHSLPTHPAAQNRRPARPPPSQQPKHSHPRPAAEPSWPAPKTSSHPHPLTSACSPRRAYTRRAMGLYATMASILAAKDVKLTFIWGGGVGQCLRLCLWGGGRVSVWAWVWGCVWVGGSGLRLGWGVHEQAAGCRRRTRYAEGQAVAVLKAREARRGDLGGGSG